MLLVDSLLYLGGFTPRDLGFEKDISFDTELKPLLVLKFLKDPRSMYNFLDSMVDVLRSLKVVWWQDVNNLKISSRIVYTDTLVGYLTNTLYCYDHLSKRGLSKVGNVEYFKRGLIAIWDTVEKDTLKKEDYLRLSRDVNWAYLLSSLLCLLGFDASKVRYNDSITYVYNTAYGKVILGGTKNDVYEGEVAIIVDIGGNDRYNVDANLIVDLSGDDVYEGRVASGFFKSSVIIDHSGNDVYSCHSFSCASGVVGFGVIFDRSGNDVYFGGIHSVGSGTFGGGYIFDLSGDDVYKSITYGQGFAGPFGFGVLFDSSGNDVYVIGFGQIHEPLYKTQRIGIGQGFGMGLREDLGGGIGLLVDLRGNDLYSSGTYAQGSSYWYSFGGLYDVEGDDRYTCTQYCQGAGIHLSTAILKDVSGDDVYLSFNGPSLGSGHDLSVGVFYDSAGNDIYRTYGGIGMGLTNSVGIFVDISGNDRYDVVQCQYSLGGANVEREMGGLGIFVDGEGEDAYPCELKNGEKWVKGQWGLGWDR